MSQENKNAPGKGASLTNGGRAVDTAILSQIPPLSSPSIRRPDPVKGALVKLDACERRLQIANTAGDSYTWSRFYLAWLKLHAVAFGGAR